MRVDGRVFRLEEGDTCKTAGVGVNLLCSLLFECGNMLCVFLGGGWCYAIEYVVRKISKTNRI